MEPAQLYATHSTVTCTERLAELPAATSFKDPKPPSAFMKLCLQETLTSHAQEPGVAAMVLPPFLLKRDRLGLDLNNDGKVGWRDVWVYLVGVIKDRSAYLLTLLTRK